MSVLVQNGTTKYQAYAGGEIPSGYTVYDGPFIRDPDDEYGVLMVWDTDNIRPMNTAELLVKAKNRKIKLLQRVGVSKAKAIYPFIRNMRDIVFIKEMVAMIKPAAREPLSGGLLQLSNLEDSFNTKKDEINALTTEIAVDNYDLQGGW